MMSHNVNGHQLTHVITKSAVRNHLLRKVINLRATINNLNVFTSLDEYQISRECDMTTLAFIFFFSQQVDYDVYKFVMIN